MPPCIPKNLALFFGVLDRIVEGFAILLLIVMIANVFVAVVTRRFLGFMFSWSEELTLLCLTWFSFLGIAIGFREDLHMGMDLWDRWLSPGVKAIWDRGIEAVVFLFGLYLVFWGWSFTAAMSGSVLAATGFPNAIQYAVMPITGGLVCVYSILKLLGFDLRRYREIEDEIRRDV